MADGIHDEGDSRVRVKYNTIDDEVPRPQRFPSKSRVEDM